MLVVAVALVDDEDKVLLQQRAPGRSMAGLWEFPGGKVEVGETPEAALVREIAEELGIEVAEDALEPCAFASAPSGDRQMVLLLYLCRTWSGIPRALDASALAWVATPDMRHMAMPPADVPLVDALETQL